MQSIIKVNGKEIKGAMAAIDTLDNVGFIYFGHAYDYEFDFEHNVVEINIFGEVGERLPD